MEGIKAKKDERYRAGDKLVNHRRLLKTKKENVTSEQYQMYQIMMKWDKLDVGPTTDAGPSVLQIRQKLDELSIQEMKQQIE